MAGPSGTPTRTPVPQQDVLPGDILRNGTEWHNLGTTQAPNWVQVTRDVNGIPQVFDSSDQRYVAHPNGNFEKMDPNDKGKGYVKVEGEWIGSGGKQTSGAQGQLNGQTSGQPTATPTPRAGNTPAPQATASAQATATGTPKPQATMPPNLNAEEQKQWNLLYGGMPTPAAQATPQATATPAPGTNITPPAGNTPPTTPSGNVVQGQGAGNGVEQLKQQAASAEQLYGLPPGLLVNLVNHEDPTWDPSVINSASSHATGLGQLLLSSIVGDTTPLENLTPEQKQKLEDFRANPGQQLKVAAQMLAEAYSRYGDWEKALGAYALGQGSVDEAIGMGGDWKKNLDTISLRYGSATGNPATAWASAFIANVMGGKGVINPSAVGGNQPTNGAGASGSGATGSTTQQPTTPPPPPPNNVTGYAPPSVIPGGLRSRFGTEDKGTPVYQRPEENKLAQIPGTGPGQVGLRTSNIGETPGTDSGQGVGFGYNPFAIRAGLAGLDVTAPNASGLAAFNIPFGGQPNERTGSFSPSTAATQFTSKYLDNPYSADNPIEQAQLAGVLVKPTPNIGNAYGGQALTSMQPYARGGGLTLRGPATLIDNATGQAIASFVDSQHQTPETLFDHGGGISVLNHAATNPMPDNPNTGMIRRFDDGGGIDSAFGDATQNATNNAGGAATVTQPEPAGATSSASSSAPSGLGGYQAPPIPATTPAPTGSTSSSSPTSGFNYVLPNSPTPPSGLTANQSSGVADPNGQPDPAGINPMPTLTNSQNYENQYNQYLQSLAGMESGNAQARLDALNGLNSASAADRTALGAAQRERDTTDYKYPAVGLPKPGELMPPIGTSGLGLGSPGPGMRYALLTPEDQYNRMAGQLQTAGSALSGLVSSAQRIAELRHALFLNQIGAGSGGGSISSRSSSGGGGLPALSGAQQAFAITHGASG